MTVPISSPAKVTNKKQKKQKMDSNIAQFKLVVVGDGAVGKTCLLLSYANDKFPTDYVPTVFENYTVELTLNNQQTQLILWDTAGQEGYEKLRLVSYQGAQIILLVFSVVDRVSFDNAIQKWLPEIKQNAPENITILFVGSKIDLRSEHPNSMSTEEARKTLQSLGYEYRECSALTQEGLKEAVSFALRLRMLQKEKPQDKAAHNENKKKKTRCSLI